MNLIKREKYRPIKDVSDLYVKKFWNKVNIGLDNDCWEWNGTISFYGYGVFNIDGVVLKSHRVSFFIKNKIDPKELMVCHSCDNRKCVNPNHLFLGTNKDNMQDALSKKRMFVGEKNHQSKLLDIDVLNIRKLYLNGDISQDKLSKMFGVGQDQISRIVNNKLWKHVK
jgi:hypothetical protein